MRWPLEFQFHKNRLQWWSLAFDPQTHSHARCNLMLEPGVRQYLVDGGLPCPTSELWVFDRMVQHSFVSEKIRLNSCEFLGPGAKCPGAIPWIARLDMRWSLEETHLWQQQVCTPKSSGFLKPSLKSWILTHQSDAKLDQGDACVAVAWCVPAFCAGHKVGEWRVCSADCGAGGVGNSQSRAGCPKVECRECPKMLI